MEFIGIEHKSHFFEEYNICPFCHIAMKPVLLAHTPPVKKLNRFEFLILTWRCPVKKCEETVVTRYVFENTSPQGTMYVFGDFLNGTPLAPDWPEFIKNLKNGNPDVAGDEPSKFTKIYAQSLAAESRD